MEAKTPIENRVTNLFPESIRKATGCAVLAPVLTGTYKLKLSRIKQTKRRYDGEEKPALVFVFSILTEGIYKDQEVIKTVNSSMHHTSGCFQFVTALAGRKPSDDVLTSGETFTGYVLSLIGRRYLAQIQPSANGKYSNITNIFPAE